MDTIPAQPEPVEEGSNDKPIDEPSASTAESADEKKKKKKKKVKKLEPWRSGNLESWINKWQKAQKELDGWMLHSRSNSL